MADNAAKGQNETMLIVRTKTAPKKRILFRSASNPKQSKYEKQLKNKKRINGESRLEIQPHRISSIDKPIVFCLSENQDKNPKTHLGKLKENMHAQYV
ncbi:MAG: hypothetical protein FWE78_02405 [Methanimicrococcus sp.]|nr:hypothetical protein [Methanimicrococcus sp.]